MALRINGILRSDTKGKIVGESELWAYRLESSLHLHITNDNGAGRTVASLKLSAAQIAELRAFLDAQ